MDQKLKKNTFLYGIAIKIYNLPIIQLKKYKFTEFLLLMIKTSSLLHSEAYD